MLATTLARRVDANTGLVQVAGVERTRVGSITVTALSDGYLQLDPTQLIGLGERDAQALLDAALVDPARIVADVNAYVVDTGREVHMIDAGTGPIFGPTLGDLPDALALAGYAPRDIGKLIVTHLHGDHVGGAFSEAGATFPNAEMHLGAAEHSFFHNDGLRSAATEEFRQFIDLARAATSAYADRLALFDAGATVAPGVTAVGLPGHTQGHTGFLIDDGGESLLIWGDVTVMTAVQFARPDVSMVFDTDPVLAAETRATLMDRVLSDRQRIAGMHLPFPGFGHLERHGDGYRFVADARDHF
jgi:glyoxylase-like metal-dependent hydrolase (beta-lactamase superfamily II)